MKESNVPFGSNMLATTRGPSFTLIPLTADCPYLEMMYDPRRKILVVVCREMEQSFQFIPKIDAKGKKVAGSGQERKLLELHHEYHLTDEKEQLELLEMFAVNASTFNFPLKMKIAQDLFSTKADAPIFED